MSRKRRKETKRTGTYTIGVVSAAKKAENTHILLMLAAFLTCVRGKSVAVVEMNGQGRLRQAEIILKNREFKKTHKIIKMISIYALDEISELSEVIAMGYDCVLIDFGNDFAENRQQFLMCGMKLVTGSLSWWKVRDYVDFFARTDSESSRKYWIFLADNDQAESRKYLKKEFGIDVIRSPYEADPFDMSAQTLDFFYSLTCGI